MDNQDKLKGEQKGTSSCKSSQTKSSTSGPIPIQPDRSLDNCHTTSLSAGTKITQINTELIGQSHDSQQPVNFAQGVILNIGNLAKGQQVMLLTSQTSSAQLSILANPVTTCTPMQSDTGPARTSCPPVAESRQISNSFHSFNSSHVPGVFHHPHCSGHILARSASLCDTQNSYSQMVLQRSQSQDGGSAFEGPGKSSMSGPQNENNMGFTPGVQVHSEQILFNNKPVMSVPSSCNFHQSNLISSGTSTGNEIQPQTLSEDTNNSSLYQPMYSVNSDTDNTNSINSFLDELNSELMSAERSSTDNDNKQGFGNLGDSFESLQASLNVIQGTDINLDQLDLMDVPDLEQICNDLNEGQCQNNLLNSLSMSDYNQGKSFTQPKDQVNLSKCDNSASSSSGCSICQRNICSHNCSQSANIFTQAATTSECSNVHPEMCSSNATVTNSQANCAKCGHGPSFSPANQGQGHRTHGHGVHSGGDNLSHPLKAPTDIACITDFSPDWAYTEVRHVIIKQKNIFM